MKRLIQIENDRIVRQIPLKKPRYRLGRDGENDIVFNAPGVSRVHAFLEADGDTYVLIDNGSTNHVYVNGGQTVRRRLNSGDAVNLSKSVTLLFLNEQKGEDGIGPLLNRMWNAVNKFDFLRLRNITDRIIALDSLENILGIVLDEVMSIVSAQRGFIALVDQKEEVLSDFCVTRNLPVHEGGNAAFMFSNSTVRKAIRTREQVFFLPENGTEDPSRSIMALHLQSVMCAPLCFDENLLGVLYVDSGTRITDFSETDQFFFTMLADQAAIAIENARRYSMIRRSVFELEGEVHAGEERYRRTLEAAPDPIIILRAGSGTLLQVNQAFCETFEFCREKESGQRLRELQLFIRPADLKEITETAVHHKEIRGYESRMLKKGGKIGDFLISASSLRFGKEDGLVMVLTDITERKQAEDAVRKSEAKNQAIIAAIPDLMFICDRDGRFLDCHASGPDDLYRPPEQFLGRKVADVMPDAISGQILSCIHDAFETGEIRHLEYQLPYEDGTRYYEARFTVYHPDEVLVIVRDMTERKIMEIALMKAKEAAEGADRAKSEFLARMSHEIRTPLNAIVGLNHLVMNTELTDRQQEYIRKVNHSARSLLVIFNDILDFSNIASDTSASDTAGFFLEDVLDDLNSHIQPLVREKGLTYRMNLSDDAPRFLVGDRRRLSRVLKYLCENAVKFTEKGEIEFQAEVGERTDRGGELIFRVKDTGIGIPEEKIPSLFAPFMQGDGSSTRRFGGTGLGLAISRRFAEMMNGEIHVESWPGIGSIFSLKVPFGWSEKTEASSQSQNESRPVTKYPSSCPAENDKTEIPVEKEWEGAGILLAEDSRGEQTSVREQLEAAGLRVDVAGNGFEALKAFRKGRYDLILMDLEMPLMDGVRAAKAIRKFESEAGRSPVPVIVMASGEPAEENAKGSEAGISEIIRRPHEGESLAAVLSRWLAPDADLRDLENTVPAVIREGAGEIHEILNILMKRLEEGDSEASARCERVLRILKGTRHGSSAERLQRQIDNYDYEEAIATLKKIREDIFPDLNHVHPG